MKRPGGSTQREWKSVPEASISTATATAISRAIVPWKNSPVTRIAWRRRFRSAARKVPQLVGGVDVSYVGPDEGVAAYALVEVATGKLLWSTTIRRPVRFPYITSYLTFRELPLLIGID